LAFGVSDPDCAGHGERSLAFEQSGRNQDLAAEQRVQPHAGPIAAAGERHRERQGVDAFDEPSPTLPVGNMSLSPT